MQMQSEFTEYRVRPVTRYIVTRYTRGPADSSGFCSAVSEECGEFYDEARADDVAGAMFARAQSAGIVVRATMSDGSVLSHGFPDIEDNHGT